METIRLAESVPLSEAAGGTPKSRRFRARLIEGNILGSSGYYPAKVLERDGPTAWPQGSHVYIDHPTESEQYDRPERSVRDLAGRIASTPVYEGDGLYADVEVYPHVAPVIEAMASDIGMSIRASAEVSEGEVDGKPVRMIDRIVEGISVDLVTRAGAGGKLVSLLESARPKRDLFARESAMVRVREARNIGQWIESRLHLALTQIGDEMFGDGRVSREERIALSSAVGDGLTAFTATLEQAAPALYSRDLWDEPQAMAVAAEAATRNVPVPAGQQSHTSNPQGDTVGHIQVDEAEHRRLTEAAGRVETLESKVTEAEKRATEAERELAVERAKNYARDYGVRRVREANSELKPPVVDRIVREAMQDVPLGDDGRLDAEKFGKQVDEARTTEETYLASVVEDSGGRVRGLGGSDKPEVTESDVDQSVAAAFGRRPRIVKGA